jgi:hypothetical protein
VIARPWAANRMQYSAVDRMPPGCCYRRLVPEAQTTGFDDFLEETLCIPKSGSLV